MPTCRRDNASFFDLLRPRIPRIFVALDNVFHRLNGKGTPKYPDDLVTCLSEKIRNKAAVAETPYFRCKWYLNGNLHVEFLRLDLLKELNHIGGNHVQVPGPEGKAGR